jgi:hypothetical protein
MPFHLGGYAEPSVLSAYLRAGVTSPSEPVGKVEAVVQKDQTVAEMAEEVLMRQTKALAHRSGQSLKDARQAVADTEAGRQLRELANGEHRHEKAQDWQVSVLWARAEERHYSWLESYMEWLKGKEKRTQYHALLEEELASLRG